MPGTQRQFHQVPLYTQIASAIRAKIDSGEWALGQQLLPIDALSREFGVARLTLRQAIEVLQQEGLLRTRQGSGTFVEGKPREQRWITLPLTWDALVDSASAFQPEIRLVESIAKQPILDEAEGTPAARYHYIKRVDSKLDLPFCVVELYIAHSIYSRNKKALETQRALPILDRVVGNEIEGARETLTVEGASPEAANLLGIPIAAPVAKLRRVITDREQTVIYLAEIVYRGDVVKLNVELIKPKPRLNGRARNER